MVVWFGGSFFSCRSTVRHGVSISIEPNDDGTVSCVALFLCIFKQQLLTHATLLLRTIWIHSKRELYAIMGNERSRWRTKIDRRLHCKFLFCCYVICLCLNSSLTQYFLSFSRCCCRIWLLPSSSVVLSCVSSVFLAFLRHWLIWWYLFCALLICLYLFRDVFALTL